MRSLVCLQCRERSVSVQGPLQMSPAVFSRTPRCVRAAGRALFLAFSQLWDDWQVVVCLTVSFPVSVGHYFGASDDGDGGFRSKH